MTASRARPGLRRVEQIMGTAISLDLADDLPAATLHELAEETFGWLREVDARFSTYREDSEVRRFDRGELPLAEASADLRLVLERCADLWGATDGFFDAYVTGRLDPSGYVKGWSAQVASDRLLAAGAANHCVNAGGDVRVRGHSATGGPWRIGVRHPWDPSATCLVLTGTDLAVATSGVYERGEHVLDPAGAPRSRACARSPWSARTSASPTRTPPPPWQWAGPASAGWTVSPTTCTRWSPMTPACSTPPVSPWRTDPGPGLSAGGGGWWPGGSPAGGGGQGGCPTGGCRPSRTGGGRAAMVRCRRCGVPRRPWTWSTPAQWRRCAVTGFNEVDAVRVAVARRSFTRPGRRSVTSRGGAAGAGRGAGRR